ncbi:MAG: C39 family peptidase, partial [Eubacteriales bacterium]
PAEGAPAEGAPAEGAPAEGEVASEEDSGKKKKGKKSKKEKKEKKGKKSKKGTDGEADPDADDGKKGKKSIVKKLKPVLLAAIIGGGGFFIYQKFFAPPSAVLLSHVTAQSQYPELMSGSIPTSLAVILTYYGFEIDKVTLAEDYIPSTSITSSAKNPHESFVGDPATEEGYYAYPTPVASGADLYLTEQGSNLRSKVLSSPSIEDLADYLFDETPVMVWVTTDYGSAELSTSEIWWNGEPPIDNLHVATLIGYGSEDNVFYLVDAINPLRYFPEPEEVEEDLSVDPPEDEEEPEEEVEPEPEPVPVFKYFGLYGHIIQIDADIFMESFNSVGGHALVLVE